MLNEHNSEYDPQLLLTHFLSEFPETKPNLPEYLEYYEQSGRLDRLPRRFVSDHIVKQLDEYQKTGKLETIQKLVEFVNTRYGHFFEDDATFESSFINRLPDPQIDTDLAALLSPEVGAVLEKRWAWRSDPDRREFVDQLCAIFPQLQPLTEGHTYGRENDLLPSPFMVTVTARLAENVIANTPNGIEETNQILAHLENEHGNDENIDFLIENSCLGILPRTTEPGHNIVELLGPKLEAAYRKHWNIPDEEPLVPK